MARAWAQTRTREYPFWVCHQSGEFGEFDVVANQYTDFCTVGIEGAYHTSTTQAPALYLIGGDMDFFIHFVSSVTAAEVYRLPSSFT